MTQSYFLILICFFYGLTSCKGQTGKNAYNPKAVEFNNKALEFVKTANYDSALFYLDESIKADTTFYFSYGNKANVYCTLKDFKNALLVTKKEIEAKPDLAEGWMFAGMLNDKLGDSVTALEYYKKSIDLFNDRITNPAKQKYLEANRLNRAVAYIFIGQQKIGFDEINDLKRQFPLDKSLDRFSDINKKEYLKEIFGN